jgi:hypothetical protein
MRSVLLFIAIASEIEPEPEGRRYIKPSEVALFGRRFIR